MREVATGDTSSRVCAELHVALHDAGLTTVRTSQLITAVRYPRANLRPVRGRVAVQRTRVARVLSMWVHSRTPMSDSERDD